MMFVIFCITFNTLLPTAFFGIRGHFMYYICFVFYGNKYQFEFVISTIIIKKILRRSGVV